jgi:squalene-hopene/tetraprenyl-beta-curcumene cyclase
MVSEPVAADDPVQKLLDAPVNEMRHWVGELSTSALSTATAVMALEQVRRQYVAAGRDVPEEWLTLIRGGVEWLIAHQNENGGWGDTVKSVSNISTTMLCRAAIVATSDVLIPKGSQPLAGGRSVAQTPGHGSMDQLHPGGMPAPTVSGIPPRCESYTTTEPVVSAALRPPANGSSSLRDENTADQSASSPSALGLAAEYINRAGGVPALIARYGKDRTFSVPILTHCALAGLVEWKEVMSLPFELACIPAKFYAAVRLPVVSYALPALIAIGQVRFHFRPSRNPLRRWLQRWAKPASLKVLERIQPTNGGFLEATPLTSFVTMSLAAMGLHDHPVAQRGIEFIVKSARRDVGWVESSRPTTDATSTTNAPNDGGSRASTHPTCSWPIDTNLATWVTTLAINALGDDVPRDARPGLRAWLLRQQYRVVHPYTNAAPGGWAWTDLPGGVPDADDTPGVMLALMNLERSEPPARTGEPGGVSPRTSDEHVRGLTPSGSPSVSAIAERGSIPPLPPNDPIWILPPFGSRKRSRLKSWFQWSMPEFMNDDIGCHDAVCGANGWLSDLQNSDGGWPTFCRGWGTLPFDRSSPDISAHVIRAMSSLLNSWKSQLEQHPTNFLARSSADTIFQEVSLDIAGGLKFLKRTQRPDGSWLPLWFGNQHAPNDENPTYGTAKVLAAFQALGRMSDESAVRGVRWLVENQNLDGGWGAGLGTPSSIEETALALEALLGQGSGTSEFRNWPETAQDAHQTDSGQFRNSEVPDPGSDLGSVISRGLSWLIPRVEDGRFREPSPIGFYFAKLWYFEALYPLIFTVAALRKAIEVKGRGP